MKIKYENIIKKLIENENSKDFVLSIIEQMQMTSASSVMSNYSV